MAKSMAGWIRSLEGTGGIYIADADQKKLWKWFDEISPEERLEWYKRILKLPFSRPSFLERNPNYRFIHASWHQASSFFSVRKIFLEMSQSVNRKTVLEDLKSHYLTLSPFNPIVWEADSTRATRSPQLGPLSNLHNSTQEGQAYVFAMSFLDILAPILQGNAELQEWLHTAPLERTYRGYALPAPISRYLSKKTPLAAHIYPSIIRQCVPYRNLASVVDFFVPD